MRGNCRVDILCTDVDRITTEEFLKKAVHDAIASGYVPEMTASNFDWYYNVLLRELEGINIMRVQSAYGYAACAFTSKNIDHHIVGYGLVMQCTFSTCSVCTKVLMHELKALTKQLNMDWLMIQHRIGVHTYKSKIYEVHHGKCKETY